VQDAVPHRQLTPAAATRRPWRFVLTTILGVLLLVALAVVFGQGYRQVTDVSVPTRPASVAAVNRGNSRNDGSLVLSGPKTPTTAALPTSTGTPIPVAAGATPASPAMRGLPSPRSATLQAQASPIGVVDAVRRVAAAEAALRTGSFLVTIDYGSGVSSSVIMLFARGDADQPMRLHMRTTYRASTDTRTVERIALGALAWERQGNGAWTACRAASGTATTICSLASMVEDTLWTSWPTRPFPPDATPSGVTQEGDVLRWYDAEHDADITLRFNPDTGIPQALRAAMRISGWTIDVNYLGWNIPVSIVAPVTGDLP